jgi:hypothetical protein
MQVPKVQMQGQVFSSSAQQLTVQPVEPVVEAPKVLAVEKTDEAIYNSLFKSIESAGKAVGHAVENVEHSVEAMEHKAAKVLSQVPITAEVATKEIAAAPKEITMVAPTEASVATTLASPLKSVVEPEKGYDSLAKRMEEAGKAGSESAQSNLPDSGTVALATAVQAATAVKATTVTAPPVKPTETVAIASPPVKATVATSSTSRAASTPVKPIVVTSATSGAVASPVLKTSDIANPSASKASSGTYMKEVAPAMAGFQSLKLQAPSVNFPDLKLPNMKLPDFSIPELNLPSVEMPKLSMPKVGLPSLDDVSVPVKAAGVVAAGGAVVAIGLSLSSQETVGSVMPPGTKKKGTTYLEGLTRSTTASASQGSSPSAYLESLNFSANNKPASEGKPTSEGVQTRSSYVGNLSSKPPSTPDRSTIKSFKFAPTAFDPNAVERMEPPNTTFRPATTVASPPRGEPSNPNPPMEPRSSTIKTFNFAPNGAQRMTTPNAPSPPTSGNEVKSSSASEDVNRKSSNPVFNFSPQSFDPNKPYGSSMGNSGNYGGSGLSSGNAVSQSNDWRSEENGGYTWSDPDTPLQRSGPGVSYLDNLNSGPTSGAYNAYVDAMNRQSNGDSVASLEKSWSNSPSEPTSNPPGANGPLPGNIKSFRKINKNGSYVDNL